MLTPCMEYIYKPSGATTVVISDLLVLIQELLWLKSDTSTILSPRIFTIRTASTRVPQYAMEKTVSK